MLLMPTAMAMFKSQQEMRFPMSLLYAPWSTMLLGQLETQSAFTSANAFALVLVLLRPSQLAQQAHLKHLSLSKPCVPCCLGHDSRCTQIHSFANHCTWLRHPQSTNLNWGYSHCQSIMHLFLALRMQVTLQSGNPARLCLLDLHALPQGLDFHSYNV